VKSWPDATADDRRMGADFVEIIDRIRWRLWHGQVARALDLIGETLVTLDGMVNSEAPAAVAARKVARLLRDLETYICGQSDTIINYATARRQDEPISTGVTESTVQWLLHRGMNAQHMRWSPRGAHLMLKVPRSRTERSSGITLSPNGGPAVRSDTRREHPQVLDGLQIAPGTLAPNAAAWYDKKEPTFSDAIAALWCPPDFSMSRRAGDNVIIPRGLVKRLVQTLCLAA
jgi:hypothetical protein